MAITSTTEIRRLVVTIGENNAPSAFEFEGVKFLRNDDGTDAAPPQSVRIPATQAEVDTFMQNANVGQIANIDMLTKQNAEQKAAFDADLSNLRNQLAIATRKLETIATADAAYDEQVKPLLSQ